jgi:dihydrofolate reductase
MRKLIMFNMVSLDGYFEAPGRDITWHKTDEEFNSFAIEQVNNIDTIIFGRVTYELMVSYWPTAAASKDDTAVAALMNAKPKIVVSTTLKAAEWNNTRLIKRNVEEEMKGLKQREGSDLIIFGSGELCSSLTRAGLIDEYRIIICPLVLGAGTPLFRDSVSLSLKSSRAFKNGNILLTYVQASH